MAKTNYVPYFLVIDTLHKELNKEYEYPDSDISSWNDPNDSCKEEYMVRHIHDW